MSCATAKKEGSSRYASSIRARSTRLAGSVRERAIAPNAAKSFSPIANSIACRHAVMSSTLSANQSRKPRTHVGNCESPTYDRFHGIDVLVRLGLVASLARPGGNATGFNFFTVEVEAKRLGILRELMPKATRIAMLVNPAEEPTTLNELVATAGRLGLETIVLN